VSYNILDGGVGRADPLGEVLQAQQADAIVLVEADDPDVVTRIANRLKMDYVTAPGASHSVSILSRWTIEQSINHALLADHPPRCLLEATLATPAGLKLPIFALHLSPRAGEVDEQKREVELATLLSITEPLRRANRPHVLAGDFNANAPDQHIDIDKAKESTRNAYKANGRTIPRRVIAKLLDTGYTDTLHAVLGNYVHTLATFTTHEPQQRVDYIFTHGLAREAITAAWVEQDRLAQFASDHYPVAAEIDV
jgi:endonuclease/exonuclease/phosphatase family metal-dependent hydrolase